MNKDDIYYDEDDAERLSYTDKDEAIEMIIDGYHPFPVPKMLKLYRYKRQDITNDTNSTARDVADFLYDKLEEEYGDPEGECGEMTNEMVGVAKTFVEKFFELYVPWTCEKVDHEMIDTEKWVKENAPSWIEEGIKFED